MASGEESAYGFGSTFLGLSARGSRACLRGVWCGQTCSESSVAVVQGREDGSDDGGGGDDGDDDGGDDDAPQCYPPYETLRYRDDA